MKTLDITTTQNVRIEYEVARLVDRFLGWLIDIIAIFAIIFLITTVLGILDVNEDWAYILLISIVVFLYTPLFEVFNNGQTLGKMALKMKVLTVHGKNAEAIDFMIRWSFRFVDIYLTAGGLGAVLSSSGAMGQRLGGILSNTTVVKLEPRRRFNLSELKRISTSVEYQPTYPAVRQLSEQDMLTLKGVLTRYKKYKNPAHRQAVLAAANQVEGVLGISRGDLNPYKFIQLLIKDYIVLTR